MFYNRDKESKTLSSIIEKQQDKNLIILLAGSSGVGKTGLSKKILSNELKDQKSIRVHISKSSIETIENLFYFNELYREIVDYSQQVVLDSVLSPSQAGILNLKNLFRMIKGAIKSKVGLSEKDVLFEPTTEIGISRKIDYILYVLKKNKFIVVIENIQNIDTQSLEIIKHIIKDIDKTVFIFEYTLVHSRENNDGFVQFYQELLEWNAEISPYHIEMLPFDEARKLAPESLLSSVENISCLKKIYENNHGNLVQIMLSSNEGIEKGDSIFDTLKKLEANEKYIVDLLYLNNGCMNRTVLYTIIDTVFEGQKFAHLTREDLKKILASLLEKNIIRMENSEIYIKHDSILAALDEFPVNPILYTAYAMLEKFYTDRLDLNNSLTEDSIIHLFFLYIKFSDESIISILPKLKMMILQYKYPEEIIDKLIFLRDKLIEKRTINRHNFFEIMIFIVQICCWAQMKESAQESMEFIYDTSNAYLVALQGEIYSIGNTSEDLLEIDKLIELSRNNERLILNLKLCRLHIMMRTQSNSCSSAYALSLVQSKSYENYLEYGFVLSNYAEFVSDSETCINLYEKAIGIFRKYKKPHLEAEMNVSLCMIYAYGGNIELAQKKLDELEEIAPHHIREEIFLNNVSVLKILSNKQTSATIRDLSYAVLLTANEYEQLIIRANLLVCCILENKLKLAEQECIRIEKTDFEKYKYEEFLHIIYQDLLFYYMKQNNGIKVEYYTTKIKQLIDAPLTGEHTRQLASSILAGKKDEKIFYSNFPFRVDFLGYWGGEINRDLESS